MDEWYPISNPVENEAGVLESVYVVNINDAWAVGWGDRILHWNGTLWETVPCPAGYDLFSVHMVNSTDGWIVGARGRILHWDGISWSQVASPTGLILRSVFMIDSDNGWAVSSINGARTETHILHWDGNSWSVMLSPVVETLYSVFMVSPTNGWAVGEGGTIIHWNGISWTIVRHSPSALALLDVFMAGESEGWAVGANGIIFHWNGATWSSVASPTGLALQSVFMLNSNYGWAVGDDILHWDGSNWSLLVDPLESGYYRSIHMLSSFEGFAVGSQLIRVGSTHFEQRPRIICCNPNWKRTETAFSLSPNPMLVGQTVVLLGNLTDRLGQPLNNTKVDVYLNGAYAASLFTNSSGWFRASAPVTSPGTYVVNVTYAGSEYYNPSTHAETLTVCQTMPTNVAFTLSPNPAIVGHSVTLKGNLADIGGNPIGNASLEVWFRIGTGAWQYAANMATNASGWFQASGSVWSAGTYQVAVVYRGTSQYSLSYEIEALVVNP